MQLKITIEQVKADILSGKSKRIYYSAGSLWWTHLDSDIEESTKLGRSCSDEDGKKFMARTDVPESEKQRYKALRAMADKATVTIPLDPTGGTLYQMDDLTEWVSRAEKLPDHFGKHGLDAFMMAHHQNCKKCFSRWEDYNNFIDEQIKKN